MQKYTELEELLKNADYLVEADSNRIHELWDKWGSVLVFEQALSGFGKAVGQMEGHPVFISILYYEIGGKVVVFWEAISMIVNHYMIDKFFEEKAPQSKKGCANNFHITIHEIHEGVS